MPTSPESSGTPIAALASACADQIPTSATSFHTDADGFGPSWQALLTAIATSDPGYTFDREGRPNAIMAVRHALPAVERELFDAIMEDVTCELAAVQEALYQVALTIRAGSAPARA